MQDLDFEQKNDLIYFHNTTTKNKVTYNFYLPSPKAQKLTIEDNSFENSDEMKNNINNIFTDKTNNFDSEDSNNENLYFIKKNNLSNKKIENNISTEEKSVISKRQKTYKTKRKREHSKFEKDNALKKINIHYISFIVKYVNYNIRKLLPKNHPIFTNLSYNFKKKMKKNDFNKLKKMTIGELIKNEGSNKNKRNYQKDENEKIFNLVYNTELKELLDMNYIHFFRKIYARTSDIENFNKNNYPENLLFFDDFLKSEAEKDKINGELYKERLKYISNSEYINEGYPFFETKILCKKK